MDAAAGGAFLSLTLPATTTLVEKMASKQGWNKERVQTHKRGGGMHQLIGGRHVIYQDGPTDEEARRLS